MKTRIEAVELKDGTMKYYPQFKGWLFWHCFEDAFGSSQFDAFRETLAEKQLAYSSEESRTFDFAADVINKHKELEALRKQLKHDKKVKGVSYMYFVEVYIL